MIKALYSGLVGLLLLVSGFGGQACLADGLDTQPSFYVVEVANFACSHCRNLEAIAPVIRKAAEAAGGVYDFAPVVWDATPPDRDFVYYASRLQGAAFADQVKTGLFTAVQDQGLNFESVHQTVEWLRTNLPGMPAGTYTRLEQDANNSEVGATAEAKAVQLATTAGLVMTPTYIFVQAGNVVATIGYDDSQSAQVLESRVLEAISKLAPHAAAKSNP